MRSRIKIIVVVIVLVGLFLSYSTINQALYTATGFSAKNICSGHFISGFSSQIVFEEALVPVSKTFQFVTAEVDNQDQFVTTNILGAYSRKAVYKQGIGCVLLPPEQSESEFEFTQFSHQPESPNKPWPFGLAEVSDNSNFLDVKRIIAEDFVSINSPNEKRTKALLVAYKGVLIAEHYSDGINKQTPLLSWSMAKSITNIQVGLLVNDGLLSLADSPAIPGWDSKEYQSISLEHLLTMSSGLEFNETYGIGSDAALMLSVAPRADVYARNKKIIHKPGKHWSYSSGTTNILSGIIKSQFSTNFQGYYEYIHQRLFRPMGITSAQLEMDSGGTLIGSSYMYATARDWAKIGQLLLQKGKWKDQQLLSEEWINFSTTPVNSDPKNQYGAQFWLNRDPDDQRLQRKWPSIPEDAFYMSGFQGQHVVVIPSMQLVFVRLGYTTPGHSTDIEQIMKDVISVLQLAK